MTSIEIDPKVLQATMVCTFVLYLKCFATSLVQGGKRFAGGSRPPEDAGLSIAKRFKAKQTYGMEKADNSKHAQADIRWQRIVSNDLENIPIGLLIAWGSAFCAYNPRLHIACIVLFTFARIFHTLSYAHAKQPHRAICWGIAHFCVFAMGINGVLGAWGVKGVIDAFSV